MDPFTIAFLVSSAIGIGTSISGTQREKEEQARLLREQEKLQGTSVEDIEDPVAKLEAGAQRDEVSQALSMFSIKRDVAAPVGNTNPLQIPQG